MALSAVLVQPDSKETDDSANGMLAQHSLAIPEFSVTSLRIRHISDVDLVRLVIEEMELHVFRMLVKKFHRLVSR